MLLKTFVVHPARSVGTRNGFFFLFERNENEILVRKRAVFKCILKGVGHLIKRWEAIVPQLINREWKVQVGRRYNSIIILEAWGESVSQKNDVVQEPQPRCCCGRKKMTHGKYAKLLPPFGHDAIIRYHHHLGSPRSTGISQDSSHGKKNFFVIFFKLFFKKKIALA